MIDHGSNDCPEGNKENRLPVFRQNAFIKAWDDGKSDIQTATHQTLPFETCRRRRPRRSRKEIRIISKFVDRIFRTLGQRHGRKDRLRCRQRRVTHGFLQFTGRFIRQGRLVCRSPLFPLSAYRFLPFFLKEAGHTGSPWRGTLPGRSPHRDCRYSI